MRERIHMRPLNVEKRLVQTLDGDAIRAIVNFKLATAVRVNKKCLNGPRKGQKAFAWWRVHAISCALLDTGCRIRESLDAQVEDFHFDDLLVTVIGKGEKQRRIPFSVDLRRILYRYVESRERFGVPPKEQLMFPSHQGGRWDQQNALGSSTYSKTSWA